MRDIWMVEGELTRPLGNDPQQVRNEKTRLKNREGNNKKSKQEKWIDRRMRLWRKWLSDE